LPDAALPDAALPDAALPDAALPDAALPDAALPDAALPDAALPDVGVPPVGVFLVGTARAADERAPVEVCVGVSCTRTNAGRYSLGPLAGPQLVTVTFRADAHWTETAPVALPANGQVAGPVDVELERGVRVDDTDPSIRRLFFDADDRRIFVEAGGRLDMVDTQDPLPWSTRTIVPDLLDLYLGISPDESGLVARRANNGALDGVIALWPLAGGGPGFSLLVEARPPSLWSDGLFVASTRVRNGIGRLQANRPGGMANTLSQRHHVGRLTTLANGRLAWMAVDTLPEPDVNRVYVGSANGLESRQIGDEPVTTDYLVNTAGNVGLLWRSAAGALVWMRSPDDNPEQVLPAVSGLVAPVILPDGSALVWVPEGPVDVAPYTARRIVFNRPGVANQNLLLAAGLTASSARTGTAGLYAVRNGVGLVYAPYTAQPAAAVLGGPAAGVAFEVVASGAGAVLLADGRAVRHTPGAPPEALGVDGLSGLVPATGGALAWRAATRQRYWLPGPGQAGAARAVATNGEAEAYVVDPTFARVFARGADGWGAVQLPQGQRVAFDRDVTRVLPLDAQSALGLDPAGALRAFSGATGESYGWARGVDFVERSTDTAWVVYACDAGVFVVPTGD
ncbi:MAG: hypothetical protein ACOYM9_21255, partial [Bradymonadia bacterium]